MCRWIVPGRLGQNHYAYYHYSVHTTYIVTGYTFLCSIHIILYVTVRIGKTYMGSSSRYFHLFTGQRLNRWSLFSSICECIFAIRIREIELYRIESFHLK